MRIRDAALVLIDVQRGFEHRKWGRRNNPHAEARMSELLELWRDRGFPVVHVKHNSTTPDSPLHPTNAGNQFKNVVAPRNGELVIEKQVNSAFIGTKLEAELRSRGVRQIVLVGLTTPHCVSTTARMSGNLGFDTYVVSDATAAFEWRSHLGTVSAPDDVHFHALAALHGEFATVVTSGEMINAARGTGATTVVT